MKTRIMTAVLSILFAAQLCAADKVEAQPYYGKIATRLAAMLPRNHVLQQRLDDVISQRAWTNLVTYYDADHSVFIKSDLDAFAAREKTLDNELKHGDVSFGFDVYTQKTRNAFFRKRSTTAKAESPTLATASTTLRLLL